MVPLINLVIFIITTLTGILIFDMNAVTTMIVMMATPSATVAVAYAINFDKEAVLASNVNVVIIKMTKLINGTITVFTPA